MATRANRYQRASKSIAILDPARYVEEDLEGEDAFAILDEDKASLSARVARLDTGMAWAEDPPSRTRHFIANIEVAPGATDREIEVRCNFIVYKNRSEAEAGFLCRRPPRPAPPRRWRLADRLAPAGARPERHARQKHQHFFLRRAPVF